MRHKDNQRGRQCTRAPSHQRHVSRPDRLSSVAGRFPHEVHYILSCRSPLNATLCPS